jgi:transcriptional regulator with XRE-family HTH domain
MRFHKERRHAVLTVADAVRLTRELQDLTQSALATLTGISQPTLSAIERGRVRLGVERAKMLAKALKVHPAVLLFPDWVDENTTSEVRPRRRPRAA